MLWDAIPVLFWNVFPFSRASLQPQNNFQQRNEPHIKIQYDRYCIVRCYNTRCVLFCLQYYCTVNKHFVVGSWFSCVCFYCDEIVSTISVVIGAPSSPVSWWMSLMVEQWANKSNMWKYNFHYKMLLWGIFINTLKCWS